MTNAKLCQIRLLNKHYDIKCSDSNIDTLNLAAKKLDETMQTYKQSYPLLDDNKLLLLSALEIAYLIVDEQDHPQAQKSDDVSDLIHSLEERINSVVGKSAD